MNNERDQTMSKKTSKGAANSKKSTGVTGAPTFPPALTAVEEGAPALTVEEVIDRLFEVAAEDCQPAKYGFADKAEASAFLDKSLGRDGKKALARAQAKVADRAANGITPPSSRSRVAQPVAALDPVGPDLGFDEEPEAAVSPAAESVTPAAPEPALTLDEPIVDEAPETPRSTGTPALAGGKTREQRTEELRSLSHAELEAIYGKASPAKDSLLRCWIIVKEFGNGKGGATSKPITARNSTDPKAVAVAKFSSAVKAAHSAFTAFDFATIVAPNAPEGAGETSKTANRHLLDQLLLATAWYEAAVLTGNPAAAPSPIAAKVAAEPVKAGCVADIGDKFSGKYTDTLSPADMRGLKVGSISRGFAAVTTQSGEQVRVPYAHLVRSAPVAPAAA